MEMIAVAEEAMIGAATGAEAGTVGASEGAGVVGTEAVLALARWTPGKSKSKQINWSEVGRKKSFAFFDFLG